MVQDELNTELARRKIRTIRMRLPVVTTILFWILLLPWPGMMLQGCDRKDGALLTIWISKSLTGFTHFFYNLQKYAYSRAWRRALPFAIRHPKRFVKHAQQISRAIRFLRFAGPIVITRAPFLAVDLNF
jgi:hypothetical protein